jgi:cell division initiation protein
MKLTALEIKQQKFDRAIRGYDVNEVQAFLNNVSAQWENLITQQRDMEHKIERLEEKLEHYERVESALHETLQTAKDSAQQRLENAKKDARAKIEKAENESENILREARQQRQQVRQSTMRLIDRREEIIRGIRSYLEMANESLAAFTRDDSGVYNLPREAEHRYPDSEEGYGQDFSTRSAQPDKNESKKSFSSSNNDLPLAPGVDDVDDIVDELDDLD